MKPRFANPESFFPSGRKERKEEIKRAEEVFKKLQQNEKNYRWNDSALDAGKTSFLNSFYMVLPGNEYKLGAYLEKVFAPRKGEILAIEFGGDGVELFRGFTKGFIKKSVSVKAPDNKDSQTNIVEGGGRKSLYC